MKKRKALATSCDNNDAIRRALIDRIIKAAADVPVAVLHQIAQALEMHLI